MKVSVLSYTQVPVQLAAVAGKARRYSKIQEKIDRIKTPEYWDEEADKDTEFVQDIIELGESSDIEHVSITFLIEDLSRVVSHELVQHRIASYSQLSMRYNPPEELHYIIPAEVYENAELKESWELLLRYASMLYKESHAAGVSWDSARYCLPMAIGTNIIMTMNLRSLRNFLKLRLDRTANPEMQGLAREIFIAVYEIMPEFVEDLLCLVAEEE